MGFIRKLRCLLKLEIQRGLVQRILVALLPIGWATFWLLNPYEGWYVRYPGPSEPIPASRLNEEAKPQIAFLYLLGAAVIFGPAAVWRRPRIVKDYIRKHGGQLEARARATLDPADVGFVYDVETGKKIGRVMRPADATSGPFFDYS